MSNDLEKEFRQLVIAELRDISSQHKETSSKIIRLDKTLDLHKQKVEQEIEKINLLDAQQNRLLDEHIDGVNTLKALYLNHREETLSRLGALEETRKVIATIKRWIIGLGATSGGIYALIKLWEHIKGLM